MGLADLHIHTLHSIDGLCTVPAVLQHASRHAGLDVIAITDHDNMQGVQEALDLAPAYNLEVIPACEITMKEGHLLALFIERPIPHGRDLLETLLRVGDQGGLGIIAHPTASKSMGMNIRPHILRSALEYPQTAAILVGIEAYNAGLMNEHSNQTAQALADSLPLAQTGGSDAHMLWMIGLGATIFEGRSASDLRNALQQRATQIFRCRQMRFYEFFSRYMPAYIMRLAGYVQWNPSPEMPNRLWRLSTIHHLAASRRIG